MDDVDREIKSLKKKIKGGRSYFPSPSAPVVTVVNTIAPSFGGNSADQDLERLRAGR